MNNKTADVTGREKRLFISIFFPPAMGGLLFVLLLVIRPTLSGSTFSFQTLFYALWLIPYAYLFMGVQSLVASWLMEFVIRPRAKRKAHIVLASALVGVVAGLVPFGREMALIGLVVGLCLGFILAKGFDPAGTVKV